jgi:choline dehydrogenase
VINAMIYIRGNAADYDDWARAEVAAGWSYREMLPYFIRSECNERGDPNYHGHSGPLAVPDSRSRHPRVDHLINAVIESGYHPTDDLNGVKHMGVGWYQLTQCNGIRCSSASAYLHPILGRENLHIFANSRVHRMNNQVG